MDIRLLGPVEIWVGARELAAGTPKQRCVLAVLAFHAGERVSMNALIDRVWGDAPPGAVLSAVYAYVARLRRLLAEASAGGGSSALEWRGRGYLLDVDAAAVDLHRSRSLAARARAAVAAGDDAQAAPLWREALSPWRGEPLGGLVGDWVGRTRAALEQERLALLANRFDTELRLGDHGVVAGELAVAVAEHPMSEPLVGLLMLALHQAGRHTEALDQFAATRERFREHLGVEPGPRLHELHRQILRGELTATADAQAPPAPVGVAVAPGQLPPDVADFTGRSTALAHLDSALAHLDADQPHTALVISTIAGAAGVGKTALAVHWAHRVRARFGDGQLYVDLRGHAEGRPAPPIEILTGFLRAFGVPADRVPAEVPEAAALYRSLVADRSVLVVLDNAASAEQVRPLLPGSPGCLVVVTSRDRLGGLVARDGARRLTLDVLTSSEAAELLARLLGPERLAAEAPAAGQLASACGYLPLALRIAAAGLADHPHRGVADQVAALRGHDRLSTLEVEGDERSGIRTAFAQSYATLPAGVQRLFRVLGLVPGLDFSPPAVAALAGSDAAGHLDRLASAHLIEVHGSGRYAMHDLLRAYASELAALDPEPERAAALGRLLDWYQGRVDAAAALLYPQMLSLRSAEPPAALFADRADAEDWLDQEHANLVAAVIHGAEHGPYRAAWLLADGLRGYFWTRFNILDWLAAAGAALTAATAANEPRARAAAQLSLGHARLCVGGHEEAIAHVSQALSLCRETGWPEGEAAALGNLAVAYSESERLAESAEHYFAAIELNRRLGRTTGLSNNLLNLGRVLVQSGRLPEAADRFAETLELHRETGRTIAHGLALANLAEVFVCCGRFDDAIDTLTEAMSIAKESRSPGAQIFAHQNFAAAYREMGRLNQAFVHARTAVSLAPSFGDPSTEAEAFIALGGVVAALGHDDVAADHYARAVELAREAGIRYVEADALIGLATVRREAEHAVTALALAEQAGYRVMAARAHEAMAQVLLDTGHAHMAVELFRRSGHRVGEARARAFLDRATAARR